MHRIHVFAKLVLVVGLLLAPGLPARAGGYEAERQLQQALVLVRAGVARLQAGDLDQAGAALEVARLKGLGATLRTTHTRLQERFQLRQLQQMSALAADRNQAMVRDYNQVVEELLASLDGLSPEDGVDTDTLALLATLAGRIAPPEPRPIFGALPYRHLGLTRRETVAGPWLTPAYLGGPATPHAEDTQATPEAPRSQAIVDKAESLGWSPARIYAFVEQDVETEWYHGCMKGAEETLRQGSGNDCDQAALLVALLRASGYPARYVRGVVEVHGGFPKLQELLGVDDGAQAAALLQKAGIPYRTRIAGGRIAGIELEHLWVETRVPYANYRGVVADEQGKVWLGLAPAIKASGFESTAGAPLPDGVDLFLSRDDYLEAARPETLLQYLQAEIEVAAALAGQALEYADVLRTRTRRPSAGGYLPASLPIHVVGVSHELTALPAELLHRVRVTARTSAGSVLLAEDLPLMDVSNRMFSVGFEPERVEDQQIINMHGGLNDTPAYLVRLRPVLRLQGERVAVAGDGLSMGEGFRVEVEVQGTLGLVERFEDEALAGNLLVLGVVGQRAVLPAALPLSEKNGERLLWEVAEDYVGRWNQAEEELARLVGVAIARPLATVVAVGGVVEVTRVLDAPHGYEWRGVYVDADLRAIEVAAPEADRVTFMRLASLEGSVLEDRVLADAFGVESISTAKLIGLVQGGQGTLLGITQANAAQVVPGLPFDENVKADILDAVGQGFSVSVPDLPQTFVDWSGVGWLKENPETGEAGWMLSGMVAGSMTVVRFDEWPEEYYNFVNGMDAEVTVVHSGARYIFKAIVTDGQRADVCQEVPLPLMVIVLDKNNNPVMQAQVVFELKAGGGKLIDLVTGLESTRVTALTGQDGMASVRLRTGCLVSDNPLLVGVPGQPFAQEVGENIVDAYMNSPSIRVGAPFFALGEPDLHDIRISGISLPNLGGNILSFSGCVEFRAEDGHGNRIANLPVSLDLEQPEALPDPTCEVQPALTVPAVLIPTNDPCLSSLPLHVTCNGSIDQLVETTDTAGRAIACVILGDLPDADYTVHGGYLASTTSYTFHSNSFGSCPQHPGSTNPSGEDRESKLIVLDKYAQDQDGRRLGSNVLVGESITIVAKIGFIEEGYEYFGTTFDAAVFCPESSPPILCQSIVGTRTYTIKIPEVASANIDNLPATMVSPGVFHSVPMVVSTNEQEIKIDASANMAHFTNLYNCELRTCVQEDYMMTWSVSDRLVLSNVHLTVPSSWVVAVDEEGWTTQDTSIPIQISPATFTPILGYLLVNEYDIGDSSYENPTTIASISSNSPGESKVTLGRGFHFDTTKKYACIARVFDQRGWMLESEAVPVRLARFGFKKTDEEFPDLKLRWEDYYPSLGTRTLNIEGRYLDQASLSDRYSVVARLKTDIDDAGFVVDSNDPIDEIVIDLSPEGLGAVRFIGATLAPRIMVGGQGIGNDFVAIDLELQDKLSGTVSGIYSYELNVKNLYNTTLQEVLEGQAVFCEDPIFQSGSTADLANHMGISNEKERKFDYFIEMLNNVLPRKQSVLRNYYLEHGKYFRSPMQFGKFDGPVVDALEIYIREFNVGMERSAIVQKIVKDYSLYGNPEIDFWYSRIVDKYLLVGNEFTFNDTKPNSGAVGEDTGLYELDQVVSSFINEMILEADRYRTAPVGGLYIPRNNEPLETRGVGLPYSYGAKDSVEEFEMWSVPVMAPRSEDVPDEYRGNLLELALRQLGIEPPEDLPSKKWTGLSRDEMNVWKPIGGPNHKYFPHHWSGIDCSGFVQRMYSSIRNDAVRVTNATVLESSFPEIGDRNPTNLRSNLHLFDHLDVETGVTVNLYRTYSLKQDREIQGECVMRSGDLVGWQGHIAIVYRVIREDGGKRCIVDLVHAYGSGRRYPEDSRKNEYWDVANPRLTTDDEFVKKVLITHSHIGGLSDGRYIGRVVLWE